MPFQVNDRVKPKPGWNKPMSFAIGRQYALPSGRVTAVAPFGKGQCIRVEDHPYEYAGCFELDEAKT